MSRLFVVDDIINEVRSLADEYNETNLDSTVDILPSLNRGMDKCVKVLSRVYPDPIIFYTDIVNPGTRELDIPEGIFEDKIIRAEWIVGGSNVIPRECQRVGVRNLAQFETGLNAVDRPDCYTIYQRKIRLNGVPNGSSTLRLWCVREIDPLVQSWGRITALDVANQTLFIGEPSDAFDPSGSVTYGDVNSYINIVDGNTGEVRGTFQVASWDGSDTLIINTTPTRTSILNRTVSTSLAGITVSADDYICHIRGTCVMYYGDSFHSYVVQYAVAEMKRKLGYAYDADQTLLADFEAELRKTYMGRTPQLRISQNNPSWLKGSQRRFYRGFKY